MRLLFPVVLALSLSLPGTSVAPSRAADSTDEALVNPFLGDADALANGRRIYRMRCVICHAHAGARGPNLFVTRLTDEQFLETVINGRKGTPMPAFGFRLSVEEVWHLHAYIKSTDHYE